MEGDFKPKVGLCPMAPEGPGLHPMGPEDPGHLRPISHKEFNEFIKGKGFKGRNEYSLKELKAKFGFKPMYDRRMLTISSEDLEPTTFDSLRQASKATGVTGFLYTQKNKERNFVKKDEKIYNINWCNGPVGSGPLQGPISNIYPTGINIRWSWDLEGPTRPERNQEATLYLQEFTSTLLI